MSVRKSDVVIVGGGIAAYAATAAIAERGGQREVVIVSDEDRLPYRRTKISKRLAEGFTADELALQPADWYGRNRTYLHLNNTAVAIDPKTRVLTLSDGSELSWKFLVLATGASPVIPRLPGFAEGTRQGRIFVIRTAADAERLRAAAQGRRTAIVAGAGVLGIEVAEQLSKIGLGVILVERMGRVMPADLDEEASATLAELLSANGIELHMNRSAWRLNVGSLKEIVLETTEEQLRADIAVFCLGSFPRIELADKAGLAVQRGISVDDRLRTSHPRIFAAGDAAMQADGRVTHLWYAAERQGEIVGANLCGEPLKYENLPFRLKMEVFGHYFFSMRWIWSGNGRGKRLVRTSGSISQSFLFHEGRLAGVVMIDDKARAEVYKRAVLDRVGLAHVDQLLGL